MTYAPLGSVSEATLREEDLIPSFCAVLEELLDKNRGRRGNGPLRTRLAEIRRAMGGEGYYESEQAGYDLNEFLFDALNEFAPPYCYFGASEGDGADFGFWISDESIRMAVEEGTLLKVDDLSSVPGDGLTRKWVLNRVLEVNDHGNMTLYDLRLDANNCAEFREVWAVV